MYGGELPDVFFLNSRVDAPFAPAGVFLFKARRRPCSQLSMCFTSSYAAACQEGTPPRHASAVRGHQVSDGGRNARLFPDGSGGAARTRPRDYRRTRGTGRRGAGVDTVVADCPWPVSSSFRCATSDPMLSLNFTFSAGHNPRSVGCPRRRGFLAFTLQPIRPRGEELRSSGAARVAAGGAEFRLRRTRTLRPEMMTLCHGMAWTAKYEH